MNDQMHDMEDAFAHFKEALRSDSLHEKQEALMRWYEAAGSPLGEGEEAALVWAQHRTVTTQN